MRQKTMGSYKRWLSTQTQRDNTAQCDGLQPNHCHRRHHWKKNNWKENQAERGILFAEEFASQHLVAVQTEQKPELLQCWVRGGAEPPLGTLSWQADLAQDLHNLPVAANWHMPATTKTLPSQFFQPAKPERGWQSSFWLWLQGTPPGRRGRKGENMVIRSENVTCGHYGMAP